MKAGRELDALIAEKVLGWTRVQSSMGSAWRDNEYKTLYLDDRDGLPHFSSSIDSAWKVVENIHSRPRGILQLVGPQQDYCNEKWRAHFAGKHWEEGANFYEWEGKGETAAEAICMAALKFVERYATPSSPLA